MARKARRYRMDVIEAMACGVGSYGDSVTYSLLDTFSIASGDTTTTFPALTETELQALTTLEYDERVLAFLDYLEVGNVELKEDLFETASFSDSSCRDLFCLLNENFLVYKFLNGIRVVNVGFGNGIVQYKAYPENASPDDYAWQNNGTFINNINLNLVYVIEVRDWYENEEICKVSQVISLPALIPSTTVTLASKIVRLREITNSQTDSYNFRTGCIEVDPSMACGECVEVCYCMDASFLGVSYSEGCSCVEITCLNNDTGDFGTISCLTNNDISPADGELTFCYDDEVCYNVYSCVSSTSHGARADASLILYDAYAFNTFNSIIDTTTCCTVAQTSVPNLCLEVGLKDNVTTNPSNELCTYTGKIVFCPDIPTNYYADVQFSSITETRGSLATSYLTLYTGDEYSSAVQRCVVTQDMSQPQTPSIRVCGGQVACYRAQLATPSSGSISCIEACIHDTVGSFGLAPTITGITANNCIGGFVQNIALDVTLSMCNQTTCRPAPQIAWSCGFINSDPIIPLRTYAWVCANLVWYYEFSELPDPTQPKFSSVIGIYCQPIGGTSVPIFSCTASLSGCQVEWGSFPICMCQGDIFKYQIMAFNSDGSPGSYSYTELALENIIDSSETIDASINYDEGKDYDYIEVSY